MPAHLKLITPKAEKRTIPRRRPNKELRTREHLTRAEVEHLIAAAKGAREGHRDATMILLAYRHGLRAAELVDLRWDQVDFQHGTLFVRRVKNGTPATHPIGGDELRAFAASSKGGRQVAVHICLHARRAVHGLGLPSHGRACRTGRRIGERKSTSAYAPARLRLCVGQSWGRYQDAAGVPRPPQHRQYRQVH